jgi:hypothetical protein
MAAFCLITGFSLLSLTLEFYDSIFSNSKYLLLIFGPLSVLVALGDKSWIKEPNWKTKVTALVGLGLFIAFLHNDAIMGAYLTGIGLIYIVASEHKFFKPVFVLLLLLPVFGSVYFQVYTKNFPHFKNHFIRYVLETENEVPIITNNFVFFRREILFEEFPAVPENLHKVADWNKIVDKNPKEFKVFVYKYYRHAYPDEGQFISNFEKWMTTSSFQIVEEFEDDWIQTRTFRKTSQEVLLHTLSSSCGEDSVDIEADPKLISGSSIAPGE